jgi:KDO2-lipid IV(A) lauroyltransferase
LITGAHDPVGEARKGIGFYARYWVDTLKLPRQRSEIIDRRFSFVGYHHILDVQQSGATPVMVLPHLGSWEWAAAWLGLVEEQAVTAVVEKLEPPALFEWFRSTRESYGVEVVPLGPDAFRILMARTKQGGSIVCLVADRDIAGSGVVVDFFGHPTTLPGGPAVLSLRSGCPLVPVAIYDRGSTRECRVLSPLWPERNGKFRDDVALTTQRVARELEHLISEAPAQWHVLSEIWPQPDTSDVDAL